MGTRPLLIFPQPQAAPRQTLTARGRLPVLPTLDQQRGRVSPKLMELQRVFRAQRANLRESAQGADPERVLVIETAGSVDNFLTAVKRTRGLEWLAEWEEDLPADEFFYKKEDDRTSPVSGRLYLTMSNQTALRQLVHLWNRFRKDPKRKFDHGLANWRHVFNQLRDIRFWDAQDRLAHTGVLEYWRERLAAADVVPFEVEFWFRHSAEARARSSERLRALVNASQGTITQEAVVEEIEFHGAVGRLARNEVERIIANLDSAVIHCEDVMFFRPVAQLADPISTEEPGGLNIPAADASNLAPRVGLLDGMPLENHSALRNRLIIDDPDNWAADYSASARQHGTAMASLIVRGELGTNSPLLPSPLYVRPVLRRLENPLSGQTDEAMPEDQLAVDLVHRAVRRMFVGAGQAPPAAPTVRVINFSIGDRVRLFDRTISPLARLLDWLSWHYNVLFIVSAGNHVDPIELRVPRAQFANLTPAQLQTEIVGSIIRDGHLRRLRVPAEAMNALTVGAAHTDASAIGILGGRINPYQLSDLPSPISPVGFGYRRSVKPDLLAAGGRQLYREKLGNAHEFATLNPQITTVAPGLLVASPGTQAGATNATRHTCGTSGSAAITSHAAGLILHGMAELRNEPGGELLDETLDHVVVKCLLVHDCSWGDSAAKLGDRELSTRLIGYGLIDTGRLLACTDQRATLLGCGRLVDGEGHRFEVPLPPSLIGNTAWRALRITLAWLTPINAANRKYRSASLWVEPPTAPLKVTRSEVDGNAVRRGTVQHEVLTGEQASAYIDGFRVAIQVNCREDAGRLDAAVPYALAVTLEVGAGINLPIYAEIRDRLRIPVIVGPAVT